LHEESDPPLHQTVLLPENPMALKPLFSVTGLVFLAAISTAGLIGCAGHAESSLPAYIDDDDDYVYYPDHEVYYGTRRHQYVYLDGAIWTRDGSPSNIFVSRLASSQSVQMAFHDSPEDHHSEVLGKYPGHPRDHDDGNNRGDGQDKITTVLH
jgi:hypothetical protein